jgi:nitroreductase
MNETFKTIFNRTSVRRFASQEVDKETLILLAKCGMAAPSANNRQPWFIIVVTERHLLQALGDNLPYAKMTGEAAAAFVVCGNMENDPSGISKSYWVQDCSAVTENILLAVESLGLGAVWTATFPYEERMEPVRRILNLPANLIPLNVIPVGYPLITPKPKEKWDEAKFRFNAFDGLEQ